MTSSPLTHSPSHVLVTGGAGFIGCNFVHYWLGRYPEHRVVVLDALTYAGDLSNLDPVRSSPQLRFVHGDICDTALVEQVLREEGIDTIVHFAAESHVDRSISGPDAFVQTNVIGTHSLLKAARAVWLKSTGSPISTAHRFHHVSTDEVYGSLGPDDPAFREDTPYAPSSPYAASKAASDHLVRSYQHTYGLNTTTSNCSNNYGPYHFPEKLIPLAIVNLLEGRAVPIYGDGKNVRDWLFVEDHARGVDLVLHQGQVGETYNIGGQCERSNIDLIRALCGIMDELRPDSPHLPHDSLITYVEDRPGHDRRYAIDASKAQRAFGYQPSVDIESGLRRTVEWYLDNETWWRNALRRREG